jgi:hypothetical protein
MTGRVCLPRQCDSERDFSRLLSAHIAPLAGISDELAEAAQVVDVQKPPLSHLDMCFREEQPAHHVGLAADSEELRLGRRLESSMPPPGPQVQTHASEAG